MAATDPNRADPSGATRRHFLGWQCRLRQDAVRRDGGRPSPGMRPRVLSAEGREVAAAITVLLIPREPSESTALFRHQVRRTHDPAQRYEKALEVLSAAYYQQPEQFSDTMTALFATDSALAAELAKAGECILEFEQYGQKYAVACAVAASAPGEPAFEATYWHNSLFNAGIPSAVSVLTFTPDWSSADADPPPY